MASSRNRSTAWNPFIVFAVLGVLSAVYFALSGTVWAVTGEFTRMGGQVLELFGVDVSQWPYFANVVHLQGTPLSRPDGWIVIAMLLGSLTAALFAGDFRFRLPARKRRWVQAIGGGIIAGFGARLALGCNLAAMFTGVPQFSFHAWIFTLMTAIGTLGGVVIIRQRWWRGPLKLQPTTADSTPAVDSGGSRRQLAVSGLVLMLTIAIAIFFFATANPLIALAVIFGGAFGILIQRGQICFTAAFRDMWLTGQFTMMKALIIGLGTATIATFFVIAFGGQAAQIKPVGMGTVVGGLLFGLGIVLAGACETGMMYRAMEGQVQAVLAFIGNIIGATLLAFAWSHWGVYNVLVDGSPQIDLMAVFGPTGALLVTLAALAI